MMPEITSDDDRKRHVRQLALEALHRRGVDVRPAPGDALGADSLIDHVGNRYQLYNLQVQCGALPQSQWADAVELHVAQGDAGRSAPEADELAYAEFLAQIRTRLQVPDTTGLVSAAYARPAFDGLVVDLNRDLPTAVRGLVDSEVAGRDLDFLYQVGQRNTDAEPVTIERLGGGLTALHGESFFIASKALNMTKVVESVLGTAPLGVVFSVPHRSLLLLHPVGSDTPDVVTEFASVSYAQSEQPAGGPVSRDTYYWYGGVVEPISRFDTESNSVAVYVGGLFAEALNQV